MNKINIPYAVEKLKEEIEKDEPITKEVLFMKIDKWLLGVKE